MVGWSMSAKTKWWTYSQVWWLNRRIFGLETRISQKTRGDLRLLSVHPRWHHWIVELLFIGGDNAEGTSRSRLIVLLSSKNKCTFRLKKRFIICSGLIDLLFRSKFMSQIVKFGNIFTFSYTVVIVIIL